MSLGNTQFGNPNAPRGERNNNIGNIDWRADRNRPGQLGSDGRFIRFATPEQGVQAAVEVLHRYESAYGINTLQGMIHRWAPPSENNTGNYIAHMERHVGVSATSRLDLNDPVLMAKIIQAKGLMENGAGPMQRTFTPQVIARGVQMAFENPSSIDGTRRTPTGGTAALTQVAGATPSTTSPSTTPATTTSPSAAAGTGNVMTGGRTPAPAQRSAGGSGNAQQPQNSNDMFAQIVMALLTMLFGAGITQTAEQSQPSNGNLGSLPSQATPPAAPARAGAPALS